MKFTAFKEFRDLATTSIDSIAQFLRSDYRKMIRDLDVGLTKLTLLDNFQSFVAEVTIASASEIQIRNRFTDGTIPTQRVVIKGGSDAQNIVDGDTKWTTDFVYLKNTGAGTATATVLFLK